MRAMEHGDAWRFERKFVVPHGDARSVESILSLNSSHFSEIYCERRVNSVYFDTYGFDSYFANRDGCSNRVKTRVRWYGDVLGKVRSPRLEFKIKRGLVGRKKVFGLEDFHFNGSIPCDVVSSAREDEGEEWLACKTRIGFERPSVLVSYLRRYFISRDGVFRVTIDRGVTFRSCGLVPSTYMTDDPTRWGERVVVELKYAPGYDIAAMGVTRGFPWRLSRHSKYALALEACHGIHRDGDGG